MRSPSPALLRQYVDELTSALIEIGLADDQNPAIIINLRTNTSLVSFSGAGAISAAMRSDDYEAIYRSLASVRAYNSKLLDGALLQLMYEFSSGKLLRHRLAFFPSLTCCLFRKSPKSIYRMLYFLK